jgi:hypothetical protein
METAEKIKKAEQALAKLERSQALKKIKERKQETRKKIQWGGLIVKSQMDQYTKDVILGALIDAKIQIDSAEENKRLFEIKGRNAFLEKE